MMYYLRYVKLGTRMNVIRTINEFIMKRCILGFETAQIMFKVAVCL